MRHVAIALLGFAAAGCMGMPIPGMPGMPMGGFGTNPADAAAMSQALQQSQAMGAAQANRPGDAEMSCAAIEAELMAQMQDPKFTAAMGSMTANAAKEKDKIDRAMAGQAVKVEGDEAGKYGMSTGADLITMMPQIMRGQRLNELATAKSCPFLKAPPR